MSTDNLMKLLIEGMRYDIMFNTFSSTENGMKISIQGKSIEDSCYLYDKLHEYLFANNIPFKVATSKRFGLIDTHKEQSHKAMTIYCIDGFYFSQLCEEVYTLTLDYKGWEDIKTPTSYKHYAGGLYFRKDRDANGNYIPAN